jgi:hypothetical protein
MGDHFLVVRIEDAGRANCRAFIMLTAILQIVFADHVDRAEMSQLF